VPGPGARSSAGFVESLAAARIGTTYNFYRDGERAALLRERLCAYLEERAGASVILVAEAPGYRGTRISGIPLTSERQLQGEGPSEATASIVHRALAELGLEASVLLWNVVPTHPGGERSNRRPTRPEVEAGLPYALALARGRRVVTLGRIAQQALGGAYLRHPAHGGASEFRRGLQALCLPPGRRPPRAGEAPRGTASIVRSAGTACAVLPGPSHEDLQRQDRRDHA
jgi:uracil-DNA glycosylase